MFGLNTLAISRLNSNMGAFAEETFSENLSTKIFFLSHMKRNETAPGAALQGAGGDRPYDSSDQKRKKKEVK